MPTGAVIAEQSVHLLPVEPVLGAPQNASHAEVQIILRKNMYDWGVSTGRDADVSSTVLTTV